jgi:hypothetical protein
MFKIIYEIISLDEHYNISKEVDILKGIYKMPISLKEFYILGYRRGLKIKK